MIRMIATNTKLLFISNLFCLLFHKQKKEQYMNKVIYLILILILIIALYLLEGKLV